MFTNNNVQRLWKKIDKRDQEIFNFNIKEMDWVAYSFLYIRGMRKYWFKEDESTLDQARKRWNR